MVKTSDRDEKHFLTVLSTPRSLVQIVSLVVEEKGSEIHDGIRTNEKLELVRACCSRGGLEVTNDIELLGQIPANYSWSSSTGNKNNIRVYGLLRSVIRMIYRIHLVDRTPVVENSSA